MENVIVEQSDVSSHIPRLNVLRGLRAALLLGIVGAAATALVAFCFMANGWFLNGTDALERSDDLRYFPFKFAIAIFGVSLLFAATGWATYAPRGEYRFTITLGILAVTSVALWILILIVRKTVAPWDKVEKLETPLQVFFVVLACAASPVAGLVLSIIRCVSVVPPSDAQTPPPAAS